MGKNNSKLKNKNRAQNVACNFRFPSITSLSMKKQNVHSNPPCMTITQWLSILDLSQYEHLFNKFQEIKNVMKYNEKDLKDLGVENDTHCFQMASSLVALRTKYERRTNSAVSTNDQSQRHSLAIDPATILNQETTESDILIIKNINQSKSLSNIKMEGFTQEVQTDTVQLKKILEWELSLDTRDLRSHGWYHGAIPRSRAEEIVREQNGDFLVRDCISQPGDYVLSCRSQGQNLHFLINKIVLQPDTVYESVQYRFEEDGFDTVPDLITYYVGSEKPITVASGARIRNPRNRLYPLSFYANKYEVQLQQNYFNHLNGSSPRPPKNLPLMHGMQQRTLSLLPGEANRLCRTPDARDQNYSFSNSLPRRSFFTKIQTCSSNKTMPRNRKTGTTISGATATDVSSSPSPPFESTKYANGCFEEPPPKPSRLVKSFSAQDELRKNSFYLASGGSDSGNGSGDSVQSCTNDVDSDRTTPVSTMQRDGCSGVAIRYPKYYCMSSANSLTTLKAYSYEAIVDDVSTLSLNGVNGEPGSAFNLDLFHTLLLPGGEHKPLDTSALQGLHMILMDSGSRILANHLLRVDLELTIKQLKEDADYMCKTGIELCVLPQGRQHRMDLIERTECVKLLVAVTILTCATESERADLLNKWIEVAIDTKTALGNLFGFCNIMLGLCTPQVQRLNETWHVLRQKYTDSAFNFEAKLRPTLKSMNESTNPLAPNTTIPHLLPIILLYEKGFEDFTGDLCGNKSNPLYSCIGQWESSTSDLGLSTIYAHLNSTRQYLKSLCTFRRNAEIVLADWKVNDLLTDIFRTEFHLKFLWGSQGATAPLDERHSKFEHVLDVISQKCEMPELDSNDEPRSGYGTSV